MGLLIHDFEIWCFNGTKMLSHQSKSDFEKIQNHFYWSWFPPQMKGQITDKRTDVWSRHFMIWKINFGLWAVAMAGQWEKVVWADSEQLFWVFFSIFHGQKEICFEFFLHCCVRTEKVHKIKLKIFKKIFGKKFYLRKTSFFQG